MHIRRDSKSQFIFSVTATMVSDSQSFLQPEFAFLNLEQVVPSFIRFDQ